MPQIIVQEVVREVPKIIEVPVTTVVGNQRHINGVVSKNIDTIMLVLEG